MRITPFRNGSRLSVSVSFSDSDASLYGVDKTPSVVHSVAEIIQSVQHTTQ